MHVTPNRTPPAPRPWKKPLTPPSPTGPPPPCRAASTSCGGDNSNRPRHRIGEPMAGVCIVNMVCAVRHGNKPSVALGEDRAGHVGCDLGQTSPRRDVPMLSSGRATRTPPLGNGWEGGLRGGRRGSFGCSAKRGCWKTRHRLGVRCAALVIWILTGTDGGICQMGCGGWLPCAAAAAAAAVAAGSRRTGAWWRWWWCVVDFGWEYILGGSRGFDNGGRRESRRHLYILVYFVYQN